MSDLVVLFWYGVCVPLFLFEFVSFFVLFNMVRQDFSTVKADLFGKALCAESDGVHFSPCPRHVIS